MATPPHRIATRLFRGGREEDRLLVTRVEGRDVVVVADGAGGTGSGGPAAELACARILAAAAAGARGSKAWQEALHEPDRAIVDSGRGGETTAVVIELDALQIHGASVGDSGAWLVAADALVDLTAAQRRKPLLGSGSAQPVGFSALVVAGRVLVATDGLLAYAPPRDLAAIVRTGELEDAATRLIAHVRLRSGALPDDVALVLCDVGDP